MTSTTESLWAARRARARRWLQAGSSLHGYPAVPDEEETEATLTIGRRTRQHYRGKL
jgi:hypothetical protein